MYKVTYPCCSCNSQSFITLYKQIARERERKTLKSYNTYALKTFIPNSPKANAINVAEKLSSIRRPSRLISRSPSRVAMTWQSAQTKHNWLLVSSSFGPEKSTRVSTLNSIVDAPLRWWRIVNASTVKNWRVLRGYMKIWRKKKDVIKTNLNSMILFV